MSNPKQGGDLFDMAKDGTSVPGDAGKQNTVPSVPNPHQKYSPPGVNLASAAENPVDTSAPDDKGVGVGEGTSATGYPLPDSTAQKPSGRGGK